MTGTTIADAGSLHKALGQIRQKGFSVDDGEYTIGVHCFAVPVLDVAGEVVAAVSASIPSRAYLIALRRER